MDWVERARALAIEAHAGQQDKAGRPYIEHVARVAGAIEDDPIAQATAWLHDVVEDCDDHASRVGDFPAPIQRAVQLMSRNSAPDADTYYARIAADPVALKVKLADIADNADEARLAALDWTPPYGESAERILQRFLDTCGPLPRWQPVTQGTPLG